MVGLARTSWLHREASYEPSPEKTGKGKENPNETGVSQEAAALF